MAHIWVVHRSREIARICITSIVRVEEDEDEGHGSNLQTTALHCVCDKAQICAYRWSTEDGREYNQPRDALACLSRKVGLKNPCLSASLTENLAMFLRASPAKGFQSSST